MIQERFTQSTLSMISMKLLDSFGTEDTENFGATGLGFLCALREILGALFVKCCVKFFFLL
jgi:hypothetical protein